MLRDHPRVGPRSDVPETRLLRLEVGRMRHIAQRETGLNHNNAEQQHTTGRHCESNLWRQHVSANTPKRTSASDRQYDSV
eukprot:10925187-Alexandrium_andersonii.AAC.1